MPFKKGTSGNSKGRPKGKRKVKPVIERLLEKALPSIEKEMRTDPMARKEFYADLIKIVLTVNK